MMTSKEAMKTGSGEKVVEFLFELGARAEQGAIASALFRAQNNSSRAKRGRRGRRDRYSNKNEALAALVMSLDIFKQHKFGWGYDEATIGYPHVLYVELPQGQVSFHSAKRFAGPIHDREWDSERASADRIAGYCDSVLQESKTVYSCVPMGKHAGISFDLVPLEYFDWMKSKSIVPAKYSDLFWASVERQKVQHG